VFPAFDLIEREVKLFFGVESTILVPVFETSLDSLFVLSQSQGLVFAIAPPVDPLGGIW